MNINYIKNCTLLAPLVYEIMLLAVRLEIWMVDIFDNHKEQSRWKTLTGI